jgi:hypothetical protein
MNVCRLFLAILATAVVTADAYACGDSLYRVGKGVSYRTYAAPLPGSVLVYGKSEGAKQLAAELARSGHGVRFVSNDEELQAELGAGGYDVVIAAYSDQSAIRAGTRTATDAPKFLPVAQTGEEQAAARKDYERVMLAQNDEIKHYLKAIHQTLKTSR